jgi:Sulfatase
VNPTRRGHGAIAAARAITASYFLAVAGYCFLSYTPFAYLHFIKPNVLPALTDFVKLTPWLFCLMLLITTLTLMETLRGGRGSTAARVYTGAMAAAGAAMMIRPPLADIGNTPRAFVAGLLALVPPVWLAIVDHRIWPSPQVRPADRFRALVSCGVSAVAAWGMYTIAVPFRLSQTAGLGLSATGLAIGLGSSLIVDLFVFMVLYVALAAIMGLAPALGQAEHVARSGHIEYWLFLTLLAVSVTLVQALLVGASLAFSGRDAWMAAAATGATIAIVWADAARLRAQTPGYQSPVFNSPSAASSPQMESLALFASPVAGRGGRVAALCVLAVLPVVAYGMAAAIAQFDWNFLMQKLGVLVVWLVTFCAVYAAIGDFPRGRWNSSLQVAMPLLALLLYVGLATIEPGLVLERYAAVDPSFRLVRDAKTIRSSETAEYYTFLHSQTLVSPRRIQPPEVDFVRPLHASEGRKPYIFLLLVDSLRRDYLSAYNPAVTFTPEIKKLAADSFVFERAFTRYSGTGMAVPAIWAGGMNIHMVDQPSFKGRNTLMKLIEVNDYTQMMTVDHIIEAFVAGDAKLQRLADGRFTESDACRTLDALERALDARGPKAPPAFFYALPQNAHIATAATRKMPPGETYPGFFDKVAAGVHEVDTCLGRFVGFLKRVNLYDESVIIVTSDHGDSLGEEGRWGHAFYLYPEVMRVPLIVHLPSWLKARVKTDVEAVAFNTDITPTVYGLLGYAPRNLGTLFGRPLFVDRDADAPTRRREAFLIASSYGAVYGMLRDNGRLMYVVDAVDGREYAFDLANVPGTRVEVTQSMTTENRRMIQEHLTALAALYQYHPERP